MSPMIPGPQVDALPGFRIQEEARADLQAAAGAGIFELKVHHAGDGVRAVLRRRPVAQHLGLPDGNRGDDGEVRSLRAVRDTVAEPGDHRRAVTALAVDE